ncbi:non-specific lipid-transfer protein 2-like [Durio zibethinus]|uniref:Non-specific lipid-transfer protein 2-like n=1 Tax=Durio zibethinus TaxID=66656 RepID=A0A6P6BEL2_DURZI|nr:non-specific lipid-transfer protein 2-like [Durio zibethinus]
MKMPYDNVAVLIYVVMVLVLIGKAQVSMAAVTCNALQLSPCASAITSSTPPSPLCCSKLKEQRPCLCNYVKDPNLQKLVNSPNARKVASICGSPFPNC